MASNLKNLSDFDKKISVEAASINIGIVVSEWNSQITDALKNGALNTLISKGVLKENISVYYVPGSFELPSGAQFALNTNKFDAIICLGCVIQGETRHFDFICQAISNGLINLSLKFNKPIIFGVLTTDNLLQAQERSGGIHGNKGDEAAYTAIKMVELQKSIQ